MSRVTLHLDDGVDLELDADVIQPDARFIVQTPFDITPEQADAFREQITDRLGPDVAFIIVSGAKIIPIPSQA